MGVNDSTKIVLGSLRYKSSPNSVLSVNVDLNQNEKEIIEFDRNVDLGLQQVFIDERELSTIFRPVTKYSIIFKNEYTGSTNYDPFKNNLYYTNSIENTLLTFPGGNQPPAIPVPNVPWDGLPQYFEFDFIRTDNNVGGYTSPPNNHINFVNKSASTYNWTHYVSYGYKNNYTKQMYAIDTKTTASWVWMVSDGIPFIINVGNNNFGPNIEFRCPMKHGLNVGEFVKLSLTYNGTNIFQINSLGDGGFGSEEFIFNIYNIGYVGATFNGGNTGTFKRVINKSNEIETTSEYYVRVHKILTNSEDAVMVKAGFEQNIYNAKSKFENAVLTPNNLSRTSILEGSQSYSLSFNVDIDINPLRDNQNRPVSELFFTTIWKGYFGWTKPLKEGWDFNLYLNNSLPNPWWDVSNPLSNTSILTNTYNSLTTPIVGPFLYNENLKSEDLIDGDHCEWNDYEQTERVISKYNHKITYNQAYFSLNTNAPQNNQFGYFYKPHDPIVIRKYSTYVEEGDPLKVSNIPDYSFYSNLSNSFRWRDLYPYGFIDNDGVGVDYPFINGKHYPFVNTIFRIIPEGSNVGVQNINVIAPPTTDDCE
jgi:hypothetical protein